MLRELGSLRRRGAGNAAGVPHRGQLTPEELVDRYQLQLPPVRDLLVDYLRERQPAMDYTSLKNLAYYLAQRFWADLEQHHPGIDSLHLPGEVADAWKQRQRTKPQMIISPAGEKSVVMVERIGYRQCLTPVRALYLDLSQWAIEDPGPVGAMGGSLPGRPGRDQPAQVPAPPQGTDGRADPGTAPGPAGAGPDRRRAAQERHRRPAGRPPASGPGIHRRGADADRARSPGSAAKVWADDPATGNRRDLGQKKTTRSGRGPPWKSCGSPVAGSKNCWRSAITA